MVRRTPEPQVAKGRYQDADGAVVDALPRSQRVQLVELFEEERRRLVDGADHRPSILGQLLQQRHALVAREAVQAARNLREVKAERLRVKQINVYS